MEPPEPWYLTVVSTQGIQFVRSSDRSWRPIVDVTVVDHERTHETILGCDGRNPNLKAPIELYEVNHTSRLDIKVWHQSRTKKSNRKRYLVGSVFLTLADLVRKQDRPASNITLNLKCPPTRKRSPTVSGGRQLNCAMIVVRLIPPSSSPSSSSTPSVLSRQSTLVPSNLTSDDEDQEYSDDKSLENSPVSSTTSLQKPTLDTKDNTLRRRRKRKSQKHKAYHIDTTDAELSDTSSSETTTDCPPTPPICEPYSRHHSIRHENEFNDGIPDDILNMTFTSSCDNDNDCVSSEVDVCLSRSAALSPPQPMSRVELVLDSFSPYRRLSHPRCDFGDVLRGLLSEWYSVGACLLATATLNAAVFGYSSGSDTLFDMDSIALRSVTVGSIASGIGLVIDAWFLVLYGSGDVDRFRRLTTDFASSDEYPTYFYFSLVCRLPAMCLFVSACALMLFLLTVAWMAWPTAVLVMCFVTGVVLTLQYLIFGARRVVGGVMWVVKRVGSRIGRRGTGKKQKGRLSVAPFDAGRGSASGEGVQSPAGMERSDSLPPPPYSSPMMISASIPTEVEEHAGESSPGVELGPSISRRPDL